MTIVVAKIHLGGEKISSLEIADIVTALADKGFYELVVNEVWCAARHDGFELSCRRIYARLQDTSAAREYAKDETRNTINTVVNSVSRGAIHNERYLLNLFPAERK